MTFQPASSDESTASLVDLPDMNSVLSVLKVKDRVHPDVFAFMKELLKTDSPTLMVLGDSFSPLSTVYQLLPTLLADIYPSGSSDSEEVRLVTHELGEKGYFHCNTGALHYCTINPLESSASLETFAQTFSTTPRELPDTTRKVRWIVPRFVTSLGGLRDLYEQWDESYGLDDACQYVFFVNTDIGEEALSSLLSYNGRDGDRLLSQTSELEVFLKGPVPTTHFPLPQQIQTSKTLPVLSLLKTRITLFNQFSDNGKNENETVFSPVDARGKCHPFKLHAAALRGVERRPCPMVYGSRTELEAAREAAWTYNEAVTQTLKQVDQLTLLGKSLFPRVPAAETHVYFPTVCDMPTLLSHEACLSDVFVLEFSEALLASKPLKKSSTSANEDATLRVSRAREKVMLASEWYGLSSSRKHMELLLRAVREWLTLLCDNRLVLSWDLTDYAQDCIPRIAIAVSYEHTDLDKVLRRSKGAPLVSLTAAEDVTTLEATLTRALESLRTAGWFLIRQENHCAWDRKRKVRAQEEESFRDLSDSIKEIQRESLPPHFQNTQEAEQQTVVSHIGDKTNRRTTSAVWGAHLIQRRDGLHLRRGQFVVLDNGRMGRIVDFLPPPKNIWQINESPTADFRVYCPTGAGKKYYEPFLQWWKLDRTRVQQTASLPPFLETAEKSVYPLVELPHTRERMLVLPTRVVVYPVQYPTLCFVSVSEQLRTRAQREALEDDTTTPEEWMERFMGDSRELQPVSWYLEDSSGRAHVKCLELPLSRLFLDTPGSYYLSSVFQKHKFPEISPVQCRWRTLHHTTGEEAGVEQLCDARYHERSISCRSPMGCPFPTPFKEAHLGTFERFLLFPTTTPSPELLRCCAASALVPRKILSSLAFKRKDFFRK